MDETPETPETPEQAVPLPLDRTLALHEIASLSGTLRHQQEMHYYTKAAFRRDRILGWIICMVIFALLGWALFYQYASVQDLRHQAYMTCVDRNVEAAREHALYSSVGSEMRDSPLRRVILDSARQAQQVDCSTFQ